MDWFTKLRKFVVEVRTELKRTTWPNRTEVRNTTLVVIVTSFIFAAFLWVVDLILKSIVEGIFNRFSG